MIKQISSLQNPLVKQWVTLKEKSRARKRAEQFLIEGQREIGLALSGGFTVDTLIFNPDLISTTDLEALNYQAKHLVEVSSEVYQRLAYRETTEGLLAVANAKAHSIDSLDFTSKSPLILVAEAPEKPGNIGALLRTADAANLDAVIIANPKTDLYNPNIIRSSVGCVFTNQVAMGSTEAIIDFLKQQGIAIYCAALKPSSVNYASQDYTPGSAIVVGTEATGLTDAWLEQATQNIIIPMQGAIDSMNVSVSAGILIYEAKRQRQFN